VDHQLYLIMVPRRSAKRLATITCAFLLIVSLAGCLGYAADSDGVTAIASIIPQEQMIVAIGGERVSVTIMVPYGQSPHSYEPTPSQMVALENAELYFMVGSGIEFELQNMDAIMESNPNIMVIDCSQGVQIKSWDEHLGGEGAGEEEHDNGTADPHIWLSPSNMKIMAQNVFEGLRQADPDNERDYEENLEKYLAELDDLILSVGESLLPYRNESFLVYHPSWGYFGDEFGLRQLAIEEGGKQPGASGIAAIIEQARENNISVIFVSPQFDQSSAQVIAEEIEGVVLMADPLMSDYFTELERLTANMVEEYDDDG